MSLCVMASISPLRWEAFIPDPGGAGSEQRSSCSSPEAILPFSLCVCIGSGTLLFQVTHLRLSSGKRGRPRLETTPVKPGGSPAQEMLLGWLLEGWFLECNLGGGTASPK